jgi:hypothetical protein
MCIGKITKGIFVAGVQEWDFSGSMQHRHRC